jgi:hypothetical protein
VSRAAIPLVVVGRELRARPVAEFMEQDNGWRLTALTLHPDWLAGNEQLAALAAGGQA